MSRTGEEIPAPHRDQRKEIQNQHVHGAEVEDPQEGRRDGPHGNAENHGCQVNLGVSGSRITFGPGTVTKRGSGAWEQAGKMQRLRGFLKFHEIEQPDILYSCPDFYVMRAIHGMSAISYLHQMPLSTCQAMLHKMVSLVQFECESSKIQRVEKTLVISKISSIFHATRKNPYCTMFDRSRVGQLLLGLLMKCPPLDLPVGVCHGDLTLSNTIMVKHQITLLDPIPVFIESPILDAAKLLQDARHFWTARFYGKDVDMGRMQILMAYLDSRIKLLTFHPLHLEFFSAINLARILPYVWHDKPLTDYVLEEIFTYG